MYKLSLIIFLLALHTLLFGQQNQALRISHFNTENHLALQGYDPVSYFSGKPLKGSASFSYTYLGIIYHFVSQANLNAFKINPAKYEPAYGGWCAYAMGADGSKVEVDPETYKIVNGKLYLFYNFYFTNTLKKWNENETVLKNKADINWTRIFR